MIALLVYGSLLLILFTLICKWYLGTTKWYNSTARLDGKTALITGGNAGIGKSTAMDFAQRGAKIIIASRNKERAIQTIKEITDKTGNRKIHYMPLNLMDLENVRQFVEVFLSTEKRLDILINNAGIGDLGYRSLGQTTKQNFDLVFGVNYLGHFLLTYLLFDLLKRTGNSRIINVSSLRHYWRRSPLKFDNGPDANGKMYSDLAGYNTSKLANVMHAKTLAKILKGTTVTANSMHPAMVYTEILVKPFKEFLPKPIGICFDYFLWFCSLNALGGAQTIIYLAVDESIKLVSGKFFAHCTRKTENKLVQDDNGCQQLWDYSLKMCELK